ncbi:uncharacterized protein ASCRUDRAFT_72345 [Ascoidea rubescens DSM 1968]|uniref:MARVEL domain-containing protein n=1 Tax=Ascoidea rubescens DSM 1968 TaxID=1344418 RepID=A0A1D2VB24_9ASCO|nr:hypothetical protein ASCRUDRAFT_72345 [Ascoidea rubescens DSM 1968]ODV58663.1 hypothetical protein ASCRUDRAFT_72345 [Ascoidea rubescens DSM 1968]
MGVSNLLDDAVYLFTIVWAAISWFIFFVSTAYTQNKFGTFMGLAWFAVFFQLFVLVLVIVFQFNDFIYPRRFATFLNSSLVISFLLNVIITDAFIHPSFFGYCVALGVGAMLSAMTDFIWIFYFSLEPNEPLRKRSLKKSYLNKHNNAPNPPQITPKESLDNNYNA